MLATQAVPCVWLGDAVIMAEVLSQICKSYKLCLTILTQVTQQSLARENKQDLPNTGPFLRREWGIAEVWQSCKVWVQL